MSMRIAPALTSLRTVLKRVVLAGGVALSLGTGGAGTEGGSGTRRYCGGLVEELETPGVCANVAVGLSFSYLVTLGSSIGAVAPSLTDCSRNFSTRREKLVNPVGCPSIAFSVFGRGAQANQLVSSLTCHVHPSSFQLHA